MIRDRLLKLILIPLLGLLIPAVAGIGQLPLGGLRLALSFLYFTGVFFIVWQVGLQVLSIARRQEWLNKYALRKLFLLPSFNLLVSCMIFSLAVAIWQYYLDNFDEAMLVRILVYAGVAMVMVTLIYEILFLTAEKELDGIVLQQVDKERMNAELSILKNELDPHFFFNCLTALTQLVYLDADKAYQFVHKLSNVYKYFLINKEKELVTLEEEVEFLENYYYLLKVRFSESIQIHYSLDHLYKETKMLPCTLQVLVENAIKHNFFSEKEPLMVTVAATRNHLIVSNPIRPKMYAADSTRIGLKNLKTRYRHVLNKDIVIQTVQNKFSVKLPIVKITEHDQSSNYRR